MKVSDKQMEQTSALARAKAAKKPGTPGSISANAEKTEGAGDSSKVQLSERVKDMKKIREAVDNTSDVDEAKVAKFRSMIAKGEYKPDAKAIADKMVDEHAYSALFADDEK